MRTVILNKKWHDPAMGHCGETQNGEMVIGIQYPLGEYAAKGTDETDKPYGCIFPKGQVLNPAIEPEYVRICQNS